LFEREYNKGIQIQSQVRYLAAASLNSNPYLKESIKPSSLFSLPIDEKAPVMDRESFEETINRMKKVVPFNVA